MTNPMDEKTEEAFYDAGLIDAETQERFAAEKAATEKTVKALEVKYADRGLKFTSAFHGACPVQAYGHLDGMRFYFRFRSNYGQLKLGSYDQEIEDLTFKRSNEQSAARIKKADADLAAGLIDKQDYMWLTIVSSHDRMVTELDDDFYPTRIAKSSWVEGADADDVYNGSLTNDEAFEMFSTLADTLVDIPEHEQLNEHTRIYLYEGLEASQAYSKAVMDKRT
jgi:hypothetical protein